ncbi:general odorant-binding protein 83a-like [Periplaneta americana]|uniref:general odorant-binding protein 83a-like n=1 Tax=Periplaneta americana TaxID=6978 RepID=UPI0037E9BE0E
MLRVASLVIVVVVLVGAALGEDHFASLTDDQKEMLKMLHDNCVGDSGADEGLIEKARAGDFVEDDKLKGYMACIFQQLGALDDDGVPDMDTMIDMLPDSMQDRGGKMIRACKSVSGSNAGDTAFKLNMCFFKADPGYYFMI